MKPWVIWLLVACGIVAVMCGVMGYVGFKVFESARNANADADHYADRAIPAITKNWDIAVLSQYQSEVWRKSQSEKGTIEFLSMMKNRLGSLKTIEPFSAVSTSAQTTNGVTSTVVIVQAKAVFEKADGTVVVNLIKQQGEWKVVGMRVNSKVFDDLGNFKPASLNTEAGSHGAQPTAA